MSAQSHAETDGSRRDAPKQVVLPALLRRQPQTAGLLRAIGLMAVFALGVLTARIAGPQEAQAITLRNLEESGYYLPVPSRQLRVTLQPLQPSAAVEHQLLRQRSPELAQAARELAGPQGLGALAADLGELYPFSYEVAAEPLTIPDECYDELRQQYDTTELLDWLKSSVDPHSFRTVGVLYADVYDQGYNFLFGQARLAGPVCVASTARMAGDVHGGRMSAAARWHSIVRHELGHTLGLQHVEDQNSVMAFGNSLDELDGQGTELTSSDWGRLKELHPIDWER